ncbi:MAG: ABC transporter ATP-binding protein [Bacilli bacterium]
MIHCKNIHCSIDGTPIIKDMNFSIPKGSFFGIIGPNGSGKSTLLRLLAKSLPLDAGEITLNNRSLLTYSQSQLAKEMCVLPQLHSVAFEYTVEQLVSMGRFPHRKGLLQTLNDNDRTIIERCMKQTDLYHLRHTYSSRLSGGERQRTFLAQALAQETPIIVLDEPTNHLDISQATQLFRYLAKIVKTNDVTIITVMHDLNFASQFCTHMLLLQDGQISGLGTPYEVIQPEPILNTYGIHVESIDHPNMPARLFHLQAEQNENESDISWCDHSSMISIKYPMRLFHLDVSYSSPFCWIDSQSEPLHYTQSNSATIGCNSIQFVQSMYHRHLFLSCALSDAQHIDLYYTLQGITPDKLTIYSSQHNTCDCNHYEKLKVQAVAMLNQSLLT